MTKRRRFKQATYLKDRLANEAKTLRKQAQNAPLGFERDLLIRKARRSEMASQMVEWLTSAPKQTK